MTLPHAQSILATVFQTADSCLTTVGHLDHAKKARHSLAHMVKQFVQYGASIEEKLSGSYENGLAEHLAGTTNVHCLWPDTLAFSQKQVQDKLKSDWYGQDGQYYVRRGSGSVEIIVSLQDEDERRLQLFEALKQFRQNYQTVFARRVREPKPVQDSCGLGNLIV